MKNKLIKTALVTCCTAIALPASAAFFTFDEYDDYWGLGDTGAITQSHALTIGDTTLTLTATSNSGNLSTIDNTDPRLNVFGGSNNNRLDSGGTGDNAGDDEAITFKLSLTGFFAGTLQFQSLGFAGSFGTENVEFSDHLANTFNIIAGGNQTVGYGQLGTLVAPTLDNIGGTGDNSWSLTITARETATFGLTDVQVQNIVVSLAAPEPSSLALITMGAAFLMFRRKKMMTQA